jgi:GMP synthase-like glutamine amidotransferase
VIAGNSFCRLGITTIGDNVFTIQAHPEMTRTLARRIYEEQRGQQGEELTRRAVQSLDGEIDDILAARWVLAFITHRIGRHSPTGH